jgi:hypothetical protein
LRVCPEFVKKLLRAADNTGRFAEHELQDLGVQLQVVRTLELKQYVEKTDQLDLFWIVIWEKVEGVTGDKPDALVKFIKIVCALPHSNAFLERGFSDLKRVITGRGLLSLESTNAQKTIMDFIRLAGGTTKVLVTLEMIESAKQACLRKELEKRKKEKDEEKQRILKKQEVEQRVKKRKHDEKKKSWEEKYQLKSEAIEVLQEKLAIQSQSKALADSLNAAADAKKDTLRKAGINAALEAQKNVELTRQLLEFAQKEMETLMGKNPKLK